MKVIILAAGMGTRLGTCEVPKPLTPIFKHKSILDLQLDHISQFTSLSNVIVVVGYLKETIIHSYPALKFVINDDYANQNTSKSLLKAINTLNEDIIWINGDVLFHPSVFGKLLNNKKTSMVVNQMKVGEEEIKYKTDGKKKILEVSKQIKLNDAEGEAVGLNYYSKNDLPMLKTKLSLCEEKDYFEKAIEYCIEDGLLVETLVIENDMSIEIDFPQDLEKAKKLFEKWDELN